MAEEVHVLSRMKFLPAWFALSAEEQKTRFGKLDELIKESGMETIVEYHSYTGTGRGLGIYKFSSLASMYKLRRDAFTSSEGLGMRQYLEQELEILIPLPEEE